jgi:hypothetical protein
MHAGALNHYCRVVPFVLSYGYDKVFGRAYDYWNLEYAHSGDDCLFVSPNEPSRRHIDELRRCFRAVRRLKPEERATTEWLPRSFVILHCQDMKQFPHAPAREEQDAR